MLSHSFNSICVFISSRRLVLTSCSPDRTMSFVVHALSFPFQLQTAALVCPQTYTHSFGRADLVGCFVGLSRASAVFFVLLLLQHSHLWSALFLHNLVSMFHTSRDWMHVQLRKVTRDTTAATESGNNDGRCLRAFLCYTFPLIRWHLVNSKLFSTWLPSHSADGRKKAHELQQSVNCGHCRVERNRFFPTRSKWK